MHPSYNDIRDDVIAIWRAGVDAVASGLLVEQQVRRTEETLFIADQPIPLSVVTVG